ncbi:MAG: CBS domain-containing protein [Candidatus Zixiibacteriota bacterium]|nr:MAG: CBS domain-containing protein [candidate division Zixibacteria bacterium]
MLVRDLLKANPKELITVRTATDILSAMSLLIDNKISCLLVTDEEMRLCGIISDKDIFAAVHRNHDSFAGLTVCDLMSSEVIVGVENDDLNYIAGLMTNNRVRHIPIVDEDRLIGLISIGDIVKSQMDDITVENRYLKQYIDGSYPC